jgi:4-diphosphocytidyl-2-C-methyl-D-erythritol kinase
VAPDAVRIAAHAKVNVFLRILAPERSGFHQIETVFGLLELADELVVRRTSGGVVIEVDGADLGPPEENLAVQAAHAVLTATGHKFGVAIELTKRIPVRAGLGGGSTDAAAVLHAVNTLANGAVPKSELLQFAARLGSDVPFFASEAPLALAWGRGERMFRLEPPPPAHALVCVPGFGVATADAYRWWDEHQADAPARGPVVLDTAAVTSWGSLGRLGGNEFESVVFARHSALRNLFGRLAATQPTWVRLCGSGSAVVAVYAEEALRDAAAHELGERHQKLLRTTTRALSAPGPVALPG